MFLGIFNALYTHISVVYSKFRNISCIDSIDEHVDIDLPIHQPADRYSQNCQTGAYKNRMESWR